MKWIKINSDVDLPKEGKYVLGRYCVGNWYDNEDQDNVNCVIVKLTKGISKKERELMKSGKLQDYTKPYNFLSGKEIIKRSEIVEFGDEDGNNKVSYRWEGKGGSNFFGQDISHWMPIEPLIEE